MSDEFSLCHTTRNLYSAILIAALSLFSCISSKVRASLIVSPMWRTSSLDSTGISASAPKAREYGVSPAGCLGVVQ